MAGPGYSSVELAPYEVHAFAVGGAATTEYAKFRSLKAKRLTKVTAWVSTAGTAAGHKLDVFVGTASVGTIALGTATAGSKVQATINTDVPAETSMSVKTGADIVGKADVTYSVEGD